MSEDRFTEGFDFIGYGRFAGSPSRLDLERYYFLDDVDRRLIAKRRGDANRLGFSLQLVTLRYLGTFLADPLDVPAEVVDYLAEQLAIPDPSCLKAYIGREKTRFEHQWEIAREYGWRDVADAEGELARWIDDRAWITGDGPRVLFDAAAVWLRERQVLLPAASTLARLVGRVGEEATQRFWDALATIPTPAQASQLEALLDVAPGSRSSDLDRLRQGPVMASGRSMSLSLDRVAEIAAFGFGGVDLSGLPRRRVVELARYGMAGKATLIRRHPKPRKLATLLATVVHLQAKAIDDALELVDFLMVHELLAAAQRTTREETLRRYPQVSQSADPWSRGTRRSAGSCPSWWPPSSSGRPPGRSQCWRRSRNCRSSWLPEPPSMSPPAISRSPRSHRTWSCPPGGGSSFLLAGRRARCIGRATCSASLSSSTSASPTATSSPRHPPGGPIPEPSSSPGRPGRRCRTGC